MWQEALFIPGAPEIPPTLAPVPLQSTELSISAAPPGPPTQTASVMKDPQERGGFGSRTCLPQRSPSSALDAEKAGPSHDDAACAHHPHLLLQQKTGCLILKRNHLQEESPQLALQAHQGTPASPECPLSSKHRSPCSCLQRQGSEQQHGPLLTSSLK